MNSDDLSVLINYMKEIDLVKAATALELLNKKSVCFNDICGVNDVVCKETCSNL